MSTFGVRDLQTGGRGVMASADGVPRWKAGGVTVDWSTVTAVAAERTLVDGRVVPLGRKYLRFGKILAKITASGLYGPYDADAADGRQTLTRGDCWIVNETTVDDDFASDHPAVFDGGRVWKDRVVDLADSATAGEQEANPSFATINTAFPDIQWVDS